MPTLTRRKFITVSSIGAAGLVTGLGTRLAIAAPGQPASGDAVVVLFLRGGADGLNHAPPFDDSRYQDIRPTIAIPPPNQNGGALPLTNASANGNVAFPTGLEGAVGLHPAFAPIHETLWAQGRLAVIPAAGLPDSESTNRSHFEASEYVARGSASNAVGGGFLGRMLNVLNPAAIVGGINMSEQVFPLDGAANAAKIDDLGNFGLTGFRNVGDARAAIRILNSGTDSVSTAGNEVLDVVDQIQALDGERRPGYPNTSLGRKLSELSTLFGANLGVHAATVDIGGWDTHNGQGGVGDENGRLYRRTTEVADAVRAFADDTDQLDEITVVIGTEFGRQVQENGDRGTDHGRGATWLAMGAGIQGGVFGDDYPDQIVYQPSGPRINALPVLTDYRKVLADIMVNRVGINDLGTVFPTYAADGALGLSRA